LSVAFKVFVFGCQFREQPAEYAEKSEADEPVEGKTHTHTHVIEKQ